MILFAGISESLFRFNELSPRHTEAIELPEQASWITFILFFCVLLLVILRVRHREQLNQIILGFFANNALNQLVREEFSLTDRASLLLSTLFLLVFSLFIYQLNFYFGWSVLGKEQFVVYVKLLVFLFMLYFLKIVLTKFLGAIFKTENEAFQYVLNILLFSEVMGLFLLPITICIAFVNKLFISFFIYGGIVLTAGLLLFRSFRGLTMNRSSNRISKTYLFLYLCVLEILPLIVLLRLFLNKV